MGAVRTPDRSFPLVPGGFGFPLGAATGVLVTLATVAAGAVGHPLLAVVALAVSIAGAAAVTTPVATLGTAVVCWFLVSGFVVGREGDLTFSAQSVLAAAVLAGTAVVAVAVAATIRAVSRWRPVRSDLVPTVVEVPVQLRRTASSMSR